MKIFLTGITGYIGSAIAKKLTNEGHKVIGIARHVEKTNNPNIKLYKLDLNNTEKVIEIVKECDAVIHAAFDHDFSRFKEIVENQITFIIAICEALKGTDKPFIMTSASIFLGDSGNSLFDENSEYSKDEKYSIFSLRAKTEMKLLEYAKQGIRAMIIRLPFFVYGHGKSSFIPFLINSAKKNSFSYYIENGEYKASAVHIDDLTELYNLVLNNGQAGEIIQAASESGFTLKSIADAVGQNTNTVPKSITYSQAKELWGERLAIFLSTNNQLSSTKAINLGWQPKYTDYIIKDIVNGSYRE